LRIVILGSGVLPLEKRGETPLEPATQRAALHIPLYAGHHRNAPSLRLTQQIDAFNLDAFPPLELRVVNHSYETFR